MGGRGPAFACPMDPTTRVILDLLASVLWADGRADAGEVAAARAVGRVLHAPEHVAGAVLGAPPAEELDVSILSPADARLAYAAAAWMAIADGARCGAEEDTLVLLQRRLGLDDQDVQTLEHLADAVRKASSRPPSAAEFEALERAVRRLNEAA